MSACHALRLVAAALLRSCVWRLFFLACGLEEATDKPSFRPSDSAFSVSFARLEKILARLPEYGEVRSAKQVVSKYLASLARCIDWGFICSMQCACADPAVQLNLGPDFYVARSIVYLRTSTSKGAH